MLQKIDKVIEMIINITLKYNIVMVETIITIVVNVLLYIVLYVIFSRGIFLKHKSTESHKENVTNIVMKIHNACIFIVYFCMRGLNLFNIRNMLICSFGIHSIIQICVHDDINYSTLESVIYTLYLMNAKVPASVIVNNVAYVLGTILELHKIAKSMKVSLMDENNIRSFFSYIYLIKVIMVVLISISCIADGYNFCISYLALQSQNESIIQMYIFCEIIYFILKLKRLTDLFSSLTHLIKSKLR